MGVLQKGDLQKGSCGDESLKKKVLNKQGAEGTSNGI